MHIETSSNYTNDSHLPTNTSGDDPETLWCGHGPFDTFPYVMRVMVTMPVLAFGVFANVINIAVFRHRRMRTSVVNWYLVVLACSDLIVLICSFSMLCFPAVAEDFRSLTVINTAVHAQRWTYALGLMAQSCSVGMTILVSSHRFFGLCFPFVAQRWCTPERVKLAIVGMLIFGTVFNLPRWWEIEAIQCQSKVYNTTGYLVVESTLRYNREYYVWYMVSAYTLFMFAFPFILLIVMNTMIIKTVSNSHLIRQRMTTGSVTLTTATAAAVAPSAHTAVTSNNSVGNVGHHSDSKENKTTVMLIAVVCMFLVCNCLAFINNVLEVVNWYSDGSLTDAYLTSVEISNLLVIINSSSNIFIYWTFSVKFRQLLKYYFFCWTFKQYDRYGETMMFARSTRRTVVNRADNYHGSSSHNSVKRKTTVNNINNHDDYGGTRTALIDNCNGVVLSNGKRVASRQTAVKLQNSDEFNNYASV